MSRGLEWLKGSLMTMGVLSLFGATGDSSHNQSPVVSTPVSVSNHFGMSSVHWEQYQSALSGPRGFWSSDLHPYLVLGLDAESDSERRSFAKLYQDSIVHRFEEETQFYRVYETLYNERFGGQPLIDVTPLFDDGRPPLASSLASTADRLALVISCSDCDRDLRTVIDRVASGRLPPIDIYLTEPTEDRILKLAHVSGITNDDVQQSLIRLDPASKITPFLVDELQPRYGWDWYLRSGEGIRPASMADMAEIGVGVE